MSMNTNACAHCGGSFTELDPAYLGLALHRACYGLVTGQRDDAVTLQNTPGQHGQNPCEFFVKVPQ